MAVSFCVTVDQPPRAVVEENINLVYGKRTVSQVRALGTLGI